VMAEGSASSARHGLYRDVDLDPSQAVAYHAVVFRRKSDQQALRDYERLTWRLQQELRTRPHVTQSRVRQIAGRIVGRVRRVSKSGA